MKNGLVSCLKQLALLELVLIACSSQVWAEVTHDLQSKCRSGDVWHVRAVMEVEGDLKLVEEAKERSIPMKAVANLTYDERLAELTPTIAGRKSIRRYDAATATIKIGTQEITPSLRDDRRLIAAETTENGCLLLSPGGPLVRDELDLIDVPGNSLLVEGLLPTAAVKAGDSWKAPDDLLAALLCLDAVSQSDVESMLDVVSESIAKISMSGTVHGAIGGVSTQIDLKARYNFDVKLQRITWFAMSIKEKRSVGLVGPGLDVSARLRMEVRPLSQAEVVAQGKLAQLPLTGNSGDSRLAYNTRKGGMSLLHDRRWHATSDENDVAIMRLVDRGDLVAQCNISPLKDLPAGQQISMEEFQTDVQRSLNTNFGQFVEASEKTTEDGLHVMRVVAAGQVSELPIQWIYYLVTSPDGRRVALAFTLEESLAERFADADVAVLETVHFGAAADKTAAVEKPSETK